MSVPFDHSLRRLSILWLLSLAAVALLVISSDFLFENFVKHSENYAEIVNLSGRQFSYAEQIALFSTKYVYSTEGLARSTYARLLRRAVDTMREESAILRENALDSPVLKPLYFDVAGAVVWLVDGYLSDADRLLDLPAAEVSQVSAPYLAISGKSSYLVNRLNVVVGATLNEGVLSANRLHEVNTFRLFAVVALLTAQFVFVFRPAIARLRSRWHALEHEIAERLRAEADVHTGEARFRSLIESAPIGIFEGDLQGNLLGVNPRWKEIMGRVGEEPTRAVWVGAIHPDDRESALAQGLHQRESGQPIRLEYRILRPDGEPIYVQVSAAALTNAAGERTGQIGTVLDVTETKRFEAELRASEARFRALVENAPVGIFESDIHADITWVNPRWQEITGIPSEGANRAKWINVMHPDDRAETLAVSQRQRDAGEQVSLEYRLLRADSSIVHVHVGAVAVKDENGKPIGLIGTVTDISESRRLQEELRASEMRFRSLVENAPVGIFESDANTTIIWANSRWHEITGLSDSRAERAKWMTLLHPDDRAEVIAMSNRQRAGGEPVNLEYRLIRPDGTIIYVNVGAVQILDAEGKLTGLIGTVLDITSRKKAEESLLKLEGERQRIKVLGEFIRDTSHDLRTPLTVIKSGLYFVRKLTDVERIHAKAEIIEQYVDYLNIVIDQLQEMAVLDTITDLTLMPMNLAPLLRDIVRDVSEQAVGRIVGIDLDADLPSVLIAPDKLIAAFRAVLDNARRYTPDGGQITVGATSDAGYLTVSVSDNGFGIDPEFLPHIFERFYKVDKARAIGGGAGLGLPIVKRVMELHGGSVRVESTPAVGTTIKLILQKAPVTALDWKAAAL